MAWTRRKHVVVPVDFSDSSCEAIRTGIELAESRECVHVVHVVTAHEPAPLYKRSLDEAESQRLRACVYLQEFLEANKFDGVSPTVLVGDPGRRINEFAAQYHADVIVIPSLGFHPVEQVTLGSTAERVIRHAPCPVFVLRQVAAETCKHPTQPVSVGA